MRKNFVWYNIILIAIILITYSNCCAEVSVVLRYDDHSAISDFNIEKKLIEILSKYQILHTFGVIPNSHSLPLESNEIKAKLLREETQNGLLEVALHGWTHQGSK